METTELVKLLLPLILLQLGLLIYALIDLMKNGVRNLKPWIWVIIIVFINLIGPIVYLIFGRGDGSHAED